MYEIRCNVSDAKLASALTALKGLTFGLPTVQVVEDGSTTASTSVPTPATYPRGPYKKNKKKPIVIGSRQRKDQGAVTIVRDLISKQEVGDKFMAREARDATKAVGYSDGAYSHAIKLLKKDGTIKSLGFGHYQILKKPVLAA